MDKRTQYVQVVEEIILGLVMNGGQALLGCSLNIALTVIHKQGLVCSSIDHLENIGENAGVAFAFPHMEAVEYPIKMTKEAVSLFQDIQPVDLVAEDGAFAISLAQAVDNFQHPGPQDKAFQDYFPAGIISGLEPGFCLEFPPEPAFISLAHNESGGKDGLDSCIEHEIRINALGLGQRPQAVGKSLLGDHPAEIEEKPEERAS
jgi:hypothetical protein